MITVYGRADSSNVQKVVWCLEELALPYERLDRGGTFGGLDDPDYRALNPNGRIPTVVDGDITMWESNAILRHYARQNPKLFPADPAEAVRADSLIDWNNSSWWPALQPAYWAVFAQDKPRDDEAVTAILDGSVAALDVLERLMEGRTWAAGDGFGIADIPIGVTVDRWCALGRTLDDHRAVAAWRERLLERPAYQRSVFTRRLSV